MAWEERGARRYYYRSAREGEKVRKEYVGTGEIAEAIACADEKMRTLRERDRREAKEHIKRLRALFDPVEKLCEVAELLARAELMAGGYHRHKGEWRMRRDA